MGMVLPRHQGRRQWQAFGSALGLEAAVIGVLIAWLASHPPVPPEPVVPLSIESLAAPSPDKPPEPEKAKPLPVLPPLVKPVLRVVTPPVVAPPATPPVVAAATPMVSPLPSVVPAAATATAAPTPALPAVTANSAVDPALAYNARLTAAAQAAFEVPGAVTALGFKGRARVAFSLRDALPSAIHIVQSSGLGAMDRAAIKAVQLAAYPQPPASLQGKEISYQIWVAHEMVP